jgi:hypothetical protein
MPGGGWGKLKKIASAISLAEIPNLVKDLDKASYEERERQAALLDVVALQQASNPAALVSAGAIKVLVELVSSGSDGAQIHSASTLATIAASKHEYQDMVVAANAIPPLISLLKAGSNKAMTFAAAAIASLSEQHKHRGALVKAGVIVPLVRLVRPDTTDDTHVHAAEAIANVSSENPPAQEAFFTAGVVPLLLELLHGGDRTRDRRERQAQATEAKEHREIAPKERYLRAEREHKYGRASRQSNAREPGNTRRRWRDASSRVCACGSARAGCWCTRHGGSGDGWWWRQPGE